MTFRYRGVHAHHPSIESARQGIARPANPQGTATPQEHNEDENWLESPYSSWTQTRSVAEFHRDKTGPGGVLMRVPVGSAGPKDTWSWERSPDQYFEDEVLLRGIRIGIEVIG